MATLHSFKLLERSIAPRGFLRRWILLNIGVTTAIAATTVCTMIALHLADSATAYLPSIARSVAEIAGVSRTGTGDLIVSWQNVLWLLVLLLGAIQLVSMGAWLTGWLLQLVWRPRRRAQASDLEIESEVPSDAALGKHRP